MDGGGGGGGSSISSGIECHVAAAAAAASASAAAAATATVAAGAAAPTAEVRGAHHGAEHRRRRDTRADPDGRHRLPRERAPSDEPLTLYLCHLSSNSTSSRSIECWSVKYSNNGL